MNWEKKKFFLCEKGGGEFANWKKKKKVIFIQGKEVIEEENTIYTYVSK